LQCIFSLSTTLYSAKVPIVPQITAGGGGEGGGTLVDVLVAGIVCDSMNDHKTETNKQ
jgi:hypothetical protein